MRVCERRWLPPRAARRRRRERRERTCIVRLFLVSLMRPRQRRHVVSLSLWFRIDEGQHAGVCVGWGGVFATQQSGHLWRALEPGRHARRRQDRNNTTSHSPFRRVELERAQHRAWLAAGSKVAEQKTMPRL